MGSWLPSIVVCCVLASTAATRAADPVTIDLAPIADTTIIRNNNDPAQHLANGAGEGLFSGRTYVHADYDHRALIRFDLSGIPCNARIRAAILRLTLVSGPSQVPPSTIGVHRVLSSWGEGPSFSVGGQGAPSEPGDADWTERLHPGTAWTTPGGDFVSAYGAAATADRTPGLVVEWGPTTTLAADVMAWLHDPAANHGWLLLADESRLGTVRQFASRQNSDPAVRPILRLTYIPCAGDFDCSDALGVQDIFQFLAAWFAGDARADFDHSGITTIQDIFDFLSAWFEGC